MIGSDALPDRAVDRTRCGHPTRVRENQWGWFGAETVCSTYGQAFDPAEEARLRGRQVTPRARSNQRESH